MTLLFSICSISRGKSELALVARMGTAKPASMATSKNNKKALCENSILLHVFSSCYDLERSYGSIDGTCRDFYCFDRLCH